MKFVYEREVYDIDNILITHATDNYTVRMYKGGDLSTAIVVHGFTDLEDLCKWLLDGQGITVAVDKNYLGGMHDA